MLLLLLWLLLLQWCTIGGSGGLGSLKFIHGSWNLRCGRTGKGVVRGVRMVARETIPSSGVPSPGDYWGRRRRRRNRCDRGSWGRRRWWRRRRARWQNRVGENAVIILLLLLILKPHLVLYHRRSGDLLHLVDVGGRIGLLLIKEGLRLVLLVRADRGRSRWWGWRAGLRLLKETLILGRQRGLLRPVTLVAP